MGEDMYTEYDYANEPIVDIVNNILIDAARKRASDVHFDPTPTVLNVRIRVDGELVLYSEVPETVKKNLVTRIKIISGMNITESRIPQDGAIKMQVDGKDLDLRVSTLPIVYGEKVVIRLLDYSAGFTTLNDLGFSEKNLDKIEKAVAKPNGIILLTGATGTGKSTTVYAMLQKLNKVGTNIITVEDPVEMKIAGINQVQTMSEIGLDFATALRSILRQDPDVIMIGEIRDNETARIAVRASITGHLVLSTVHTNNSLTTIERLVDMDVERYLLGSALECIVAQRLCKKLCPHCRTARPTTEYERNVFKAALGMDIENIYKPVGCSHCYQGYSGRIAIHEVLLLNQDIRDAIVNNMKKEDLRSLIYDSGNTTSLLEDGLIKVINGLTSFEEVLRVIDIEDDLGEKQKELKDALTGRSVKEKTIEEVKHLRDIQNEQEQTSNTDDNSNNSQNDVQEATYETLEF